MSCVRLFKYAVLQEAAYRDYLREVVEVIDHAAHAADAFVRVMTIVPEDKSAWTQGRLFTFRDHAHRAAFADAMGAQAALFDGSDAARDRRKQHAETLRRLVGTADYDIG